MSADPRRDAPADVRSSSRGAHVFAIAARALPLPDSNGVTLDREIEVALLAVPTAEESFVIRVARGAVVAGALFILRSGDGTRTQLSLVRVLLVTEGIGVGFDLATARIERPVADHHHLTSGGRPPAGMSVESRAASSALPRGMTTRATTPTGPLRRASATAVGGVGLATLDAETSVTLLSKVYLGGTLKLSAPRGEITPGVFFALRYFNASGARRALVRADSVEAVPGMLDEIEGVLLGPPTRAPERQSYRAPFDLFFTASLVSRNARRVVGRLIDLSSDGVGFRVNATLEPGERIRIADPSLPHLDGAELIIVRRDARDTQRHGARFAEPDRGAPILATLLGVDRAERAHRRRLQINTIRESRQATAGPLDAADADRVEHQRMRTRTRLR
jgi:hypothetical protein